MFFLAFVVIRFEIFTRSVLEYSCISSYWRGDDYSGKGRF